MEKWLSSALKLNLNIRRVACNGIGMGQVTYFLSSGCTYTKDMDTTRLTNLTSIQAFTMNGDDITASALNYRHNESIFC